MTIDVTELERLFVTAVHDVTAATEPDDLEKARERLDAILHARVALAQQQLTHELADLFAVRARAYEASVTFLVTRARPRAR
jgi:hypothetical protein